VGKERLKSGSNVCKLLRKNYRIRTGIYGTKTSARNIWRVYCQKG